MKISLLAALCSLCPCTGFGLTSPSVARSMQALAQPRGSRRVAPLAMEEGNFFSKVLDSGAKAGNFFSDAASKALDGGGKADSKASGKVAAAAAEEGDSAATTEEDDGKMTIEKVASFGIAGILSIAVAESVFWILSFPTSELLYYFSTGEWIDLTNQEGQVKFLAFSAGWGALGGVIAQYRTVLTAAALTPWMDREVVKPYVQPAIDRFRGGEGGGGEVGGGEGEGMKMPKMPEMPELPNPFGGGGSSKE